MTDTTITTVDAWEALDSRGRPTVCARIELADGTSAEAIVPSGASTGTHEAHELRDGEGRYDGRGVRAAVANVRAEIAAVLRGRDATDQSGADAALREADGTTALSRLGANAVLSASLATLLAAARAQSLEPFEWVARTAGVTPTLPLPMVNILSGGAHAGRCMDIQDVLAVPVGAGSFAEAIEWVAAVREATAAVATQRGLTTAHLAADEGGLGLPLARTVDGLELICAGVGAAGLRPGDDVAIALDVAANQLLADGAYHLPVEGRTVSAADWVEEIASWVADFPIVSVEDPVAEDDTAGWAAASAALNDRIQLVGDDLFVTNPTRLAAGIEAGTANSVLVKVNQNGTISGAAGVVAQARAAGYGTVVSARSGETEDGWLADLAIGWAGTQIKVGSTTRSERTAKYNRLIGLEHRFGATVRYEGRSALTRGSR
jgi:enolase